MADGFFVFGIHCQNLFACGKDAEFWWLGILADSVCDPIISILGDSGPAASIKRWRDANSVGKVCLAGFLTPSDVTPGGATGINLSEERRTARVYRLAKARHESPRTTKLYDRTKDEITLSEVERIRL